MTNLDKVINDKPYSTKELIVTDNISFKVFFLKDASDKGPQISGERELKNFGPR